MATIAFSLPTDGSTADVADYNTPLTTIKNEINGNLDNANIKASAGIDGSKIANAAISPNRLATGAATAVVLTQETTTSTSYADLATTTDTVTVTIGNNGIALVSIYGTFTNSGANYTNIGFAISGATTVAATDTFAISQNTTAFLSMSSVFLVTGLAAGSTTFKMKYSVVAGTGTFKNRRIAVVPL